MFLCELLNARQSLKTGLGKKQICTSEVELASRLFDAVRPDCR